MRERLGVRLTGRLTLLAASMRAAGVRLGVGELLAAHLALSAIDPSDREAAYFALRTTLCSRHDDFAAFDAAFAEWFALPSPPPSKVPPGLAEAIQLALPRSALPDPRGVPTPDFEVVPSAWSEVELLHDKDFAEYTEEERRRARRAIRRLAATAPT
ncbi:MAG: hypothetical protein ACRDN8_13120, partial [Thermoleophilaceae bacterium]